MKLKLLAPFRTDFHLTAETLILEPDNYPKYWDRIEENKNKLEEQLLRAKRMGPLPSFHFPHAFRYHQSLSNRYQSLDRNALEHPLHVLEIQIEKMSDEQKADVLSLIEKEEHIKHTLKIESESQVQRVRKAIDYLLNDADLQLVIKIFDFGTSLLEVECDLDTLLHSMTINPAAITEELKYLREGGIVLGGALSIYYHTEIIKPLFGWLKNTVDLLEVPIVDEINRELSHTEKFGEVLWVTRTLVFDEDPRLEKAVKNAIIRFWLKNIIVGKGNDEAFDKIIDLGEGQRSDANKAAYHLEWLNYLFREESYPHKGRLLDNKHKDLIHPFCDQWEAMHYAQYFYAAMEIVDLNLTRILAICLSPKPEFSVDQLKLLLEQNMNTANLLIIQYQDNQKYYKRSVKSTLDDIAESWALESVLMKQVQEKLTLSRERLEILIKKEAAKSALNREIILMAFSITAIFGTGIALAEYGRTMAADADLARSDINSSNFIDYFASQPTDVILLFSTSISLFLISMYLLYRKRQSA